MYGVCRIPRLVAKSALMQEVGVCAEGKGENSSSRSGGLMETPRLVVLLFGVLVLEESKSNGSDSTGGRMMAPRVVA